MMNTRLQNRLTESEILKIFSDTVEVGHRSLGPFTLSAVLMFGLAPQAVAHMHYQNPPLIHRDLKVRFPLLVLPHVS